MDLSDVLGPGRVQDARERSHGGGGHGGDREERGGRERGGRGPRGRGRRHHGGHGMGGDDDFLDFGDMLGGSDRGGNFDPVNAAMEAIAEATERAAEHGYYDYLRVMPLLKNRRTQRQGELRVVEDQVRVRAAACALLPRQTRAPPPASPPRATRHPIRPRSLWTREASVEYRNW